MSTNSFTDRELIIVKAAELGKIEQEIKAKGKMTALDEDKLLAIALMAGHYRTIVDQYDKLVKHLRKEHE